MKNLNKFLLIVCLLLNNIIVQSKSNIDTHFKTINDITNMIEALKQNGTYEGHSPLHFIADGTDGHDENELTLAIELIKNGANVNDQNNPEKKSPLHVEAIWNDLPLVKILVEAGADVEALDIHGRTPLHYTAYYDGADRSEYKSNCEIAKILVAKSTDFDIFDEDYNTPSMIALQTINKHLYRLIAATYVSRGSVAA